MTDPTTDDELESLMAELEAQNEELAANVAASKEPAPEPTPAAKPVAAPQPKPEPVPTPAPAAVVEAELDPDLEAELAELEAQQAAAEPAPAPTKAVERTPEPEPEPEPVVEQPRTPPFEPDPLPAAEPEPEPTPAPVKQEPRRPTEATNPNGLLHYVDVDQFKTDTRVTEFELDRCMIEQNGLRAYYGEMAARAEAQASRVKARFEVVEATLYDEHRKILAAAGEKTTEKMVDNAVKIDKRWLKAKNVVIEAETIAAINKGLVESLKDRRDMIIQLGADRRDEYKGAARVLAEQSEREDLRSRALKAANKAA